MWPSGATRQQTSNLNFQAGQSIPNLVVVPVGADGKIQLFNGSAGTVQLLADVTGYIIGGTPTAPGALASLAPSRIMDTRTGPVQLLADAVGYTVAAASPCPVVDWSAVASDEQHRVTARSVSDREVGAVRGGVDGDQVGAVGEVVPPEDGQVAVLFDQYGDIAAFGGDGRPCGAPVVGQPVGVVPGRCGG